MSNLYSSHACCLVAGRGVLVLDSQVLSDNELSFDRFGSIEPCTILGVIDRKSVIDLFLDNGTRLTVDGKKMVLNTVAFDPTNSAAWESELSALKDTALRAWENFHGWPGLISSTPDDKWPTLAWDYTCDLIAAHFAAGCPADKLDVLRLDILDLIAEYSQGDEDRHQPVTLSAHEINPGR